MLNLHGGCFQETVEVIVLRSLDQVFPYRKVGPFACHSKLRVPPLSIVAYLSNLASA